MQIWIASVLIRKLIANTISALTLFSAIKYRFLPARADTRPITSVTSHATIKSFVNSALSTTLKFNKSYRFLQISKKPSIIDKNIHK